MSQPDWRYRALTGDVQIGLALSESVRGFGDHLTVLEAGGSAPSIGATGA
jgi:hypothetical protein